MQLVLYILTKYSFLTQYFAYNNIQDAHNVTMQTRKEQQQHLEHEGKIMITYTVHIYLKLDIIKQIFNTFFH